MRFANILTAVCIVVATFSATAQKTEFRLTVKNVTPVSTKSFNFTVAAHPDATDGLDTALGEVEIPDIPLPGDIFYVWTIAPTQEAIWLSPIDIRTFKIGEPSYANHDMRVNWTGGRLEITWGNTLPPSIDSMYITDGYTEFPNNVVKTKVTPGAKFQTDNPALDRFRILVWYNGVATSVAEEVTTAPDVQFFPHPVRETLHLAGLEPGQLIKIMDVRGQVFTTTSVEASTASIAVNDLPPGTYLLSVIDNNGNIRSTPFIHL